MYKLGNDKIIQIWLRETVQALILLGFRRFMARGKLRYNVPENTVQIWYFWPDDGENG